MTARTIPANRVSLVQLTRDEVLALFDDFGRFEQLSGLHGADGFGEFIGSGKHEVSPVWRERLLASAPRDPWLHSFVVVHHETDTVIGVAGFKGPPDDRGVVEIAYGIDPQFRGRGHATEAAAALTAVALASPDVRVVCAHTAPESNASTQVLRKAGFSFIGEVIDLEDGIVWRWEKTRDRSTAGPPRVDRVLGGTRPT